VGCTPDHASTLASLASGAKYPSRIKATWALLSRYNPKLHDQTGGYLPPVFLSIAFTCVFAQACGDGFADVALQEIVEQTVAGLGYDLVEDVNALPVGLLRITIDLPCGPQAC